MIIFATVKYDQIGLKCPKSLEGTECPTVDIEIYNKRKKKIVAKQ